MGCVSGLRCVVCGQEAPAPVSAGTCRRCDDPSAVLELVFDLESAARSLTVEALAKRPRNLWRYAELLPVEPDEVSVRWPVGWTPLVDAPRVAEWAGIGDLRLKDDSRNPTASFKDRASSVGVVHALAQGATHIACASTGNAASSLAGFAAMAGLPATIFVPRTAPEPKLAQLLVHGADVRRVRGTYAQAYDLCSAECEEHDWYNRNCAINPYLVEGKKTCGLELAEQTMQRPLDWVAVSVGDGCTIAGVGRGLQEMAALGFIERVPRLLGVQAAGVHPIQAAFETGELPAPGAAATSGATMADSIDVPVPRNWRKACQRVRETGGTFCSVDDEEIGAAMQALGTRAGVFAEPAAACAVAGVRRAVLDGVIAPGEAVAAVITGSGLKDIRGAMAVVGQPTEVEPIIE
jgi:threonine synthase